MASVHTTQRRERDFERARATICEQQFQALVTYIVSGSDLVLQMYVRFLVEGYSFSIPKLPA